MVPVTPRHTAGRDHPGPAIEPAWLDRLLAAHGPQGRVLAGQYPAAARARHGGADTRLAGARVAAGRVLAGLARLVMPGKHWLRNVAAARGAPWSWQEEHDVDQEGGRRGRPGSQGQAGRDLGPAG